MRALRVAKIEVKNVLCVYKHTQNAYLNIPFIFVLLNQICDKMYSLKPFRQVKRHKTSKRSKTLTTCSFLNRLLSVYQVKNPKKDFTIITVLG